MEGKKGYVKWEFATSSKIRHIKPYATYSKDKVFSFTYRTHCQYAPTKRQIMEGLREILGFREHLIILEGFDNCYTIEFYTILQEIPTDYQMELVDDFLSKVEGDNY